ncbi:MAG: hypothetical protein AAF215_05200 [Cyanobacteria bacterium P01_A01_bin.123]
MSVLTVPAAITSQQASVASPLLTDLLLWAENYSQGTWADSHSSGNDLTMIGTVADDGAGSAVYGSSTSNYHASTSNDALRTISTSSFSFSLVVTVTSSSTFSNSGVVASVYRASGNSRGWFVDFPNNTTARFLTSENGQSGGSLNIVSVATSISLDTEYTVQGYYDSENDQIAIRVNDGAFGVTTGVTVINTSTSDFRLGQIADPGNRFIGEIRKVILWGRKLSTIEFDQVYNGGSPIGYPGP